MKQTGTIACPVCHGLSAGTWERCETCRNRGTLPVFELTAGERLRELAANLGYAAFCVIGWTIALLLAAATLGMLVGALL